MSSELKQALLQQDEELASTNQAVCSGFRINIKQLILHLKHLKSFQIIRLAFSIFINNTNFMRLMIFSTLPLYFFMVFNEITLQNTFFSTFKNDDYAESYSSLYFELILLHDSSSILKVVEFGVFYLVIYPLLELYAIIITVNLAAKIHAGEIQEIDNTMNIEEALFLKSSNLKGSFITSLYVHLLSVLTLLGFVWIVSNHIIFSFSSFELTEIFLSGGISVVLFVALFYKYLNWSTVWTMGMVISVLDIESGIAALGMSTFYRKHCEQTGFQLMLVFSVFGAVLRAFCVYARSCYGSGVGLLVTHIVIGLVCLGNLVRWVAFLCYFYVCEQVIIGKVDDKKVGRDLESTVADGMVKSEV